MNVLSISLMPRLGHTDPPFTATGTIAGFAAQQELVNVIIA
jgi:hypothetical protein